MPALRVLEAVPPAATMDEAAPPRVPLVGIRSRKPAGPDPSATPEISAVVSTAGAELIASVTDALEEASYSFEVLIVVGEEAGPDSSLVSSGDPRVRVVRAGGSGESGVLQRAAEAARGDFILPLFAPATIEAAQARALREAMDSWSAYSYLPGEPAADVALIARPSSALRSATMYALLGIYAGDLSGPIMIRRSRLAELDAITDPRAAAVEIAVRVKRAGGVVRIVRAEAGARSRFSITAAIRLRSSIRRGTPSKRPQSPPGS